MYERNQPVEGGLVALTPASKKSGRIGRVVRNVAILSPFPKLAPFNRAFPLYMDEGM
jgi:hypothetical protein